MHILMATRAS